MTLQLIVECLGKDFFYDGFYSPLKIARKTSCEVLYNRINDLEDFLGEAKYTFAGRSENTINVIFVGAVDRIL